MLGCYLASLTIDRKEVKSIEKKRKRDRGREREKKKKMNWGAPEEFI